MIKCKKKIEFCEKLEKYFEDKYDYSSRKSVVKYYLNNIQIKETNV